METIHCGKCNKDITSLKKFYCDRCKKYFDIACIKGARNCPLCGHIATRADEPPIGNSAEVVAAEPQPAQAGTPKEDESSPGDVARGAPAARPEEVVVEGGASHTFSGGATMDAARLQKRNIFLISGGVFGAIAAVSILAGWSPIIIVPAILLCVAAFFQASRV